jgi:hypothetical protein
MTKTKIDKRSAHQICRIANEIRRQHKEDMLSTAVSLRHTQMAAKYIVAGMDKMDSIMKTIYTKFRSIDEKLIVKNIIQSS